MPFGLCNAPSSFQRFMNRTLAPLLHECCLAYLDNVMIYSKTWEDHLQHIRKVFGRLRQAQSEGHRSVPSVVPAYTILVSLLIATDSDHRSKVQAVNEFPVPKNAAQVRTFLGLAS